MWRFLDVSVEYFRRRTDALMLGHEVAALADAEDTRARLADTLRRALPDAGRDAGLDAGLRAWLLPPVLGLDHDGAAAAVSELVGVVVGEVAQPLAGPQGARLSRRLEAAARACGAELIDARVTRVRTRDVGGGEIVVELADATERRADAVIVASGGAPCGGFVTADGSMIEPLARLAIAPPNSSTPASLFGVSPFDRGALHAAGVPYDARFRALDADGRVVDARLFVAGALLEGVDPADGTGLGAATTTGWCAAQSVLEG